MFSLVGVYEYYRGVIHNIALEEICVETTIVYQALVEESGMDSGVSNVCMTGVVTYSE